MKIKVNGEAREVSENLKLSELLKMLELPSERIAVELNRNVVRRVNWQTTEIRDNDQVEIVHFVGGG